MVVFTIGSSQKNARQFFSLLKESGVKRLIDIRLKNSSQLAGFTKVPDIEYFLKEIADISYLHMPQFAPSESILADYKAKKISWEEYELEYSALIQKRDPLARLDSGLFDQSCLLCSEPTALQCHRRLAAEYLASKIEAVKIVHL